MLIRRNRSLVVGAMAVFLMLAGWGCGRAVTPVASNPSEIVKAEISTSTNMATSTPATSTIAVPAPAPVPTTRAPFFKKPFLTNGTPELPKSVKPVEQYVKALEVYQFRIQFDKCQGNPGTITLKEGLPILLDNRDPDTHVLKLGKQSFSVLGYDYVIAKAPTPGTYTITCNGGGAAEVHVQR